MVRASRRGSGRWRSTCTSSRVMHVVDDARARRRRRTRRRQRARSRRSRSGPCAGGDADCEGQDREGDSVALHAFTSEPDDGSSQNHVHGLYQTPSGFAGAAGAGAGAAAAAGAAGAAAATARDRRDRLRDDRRRRGLERDRRGGHDSARLAGGAAVGLRVGGLHARDVDARVEGVGNAVLVAIGSAGGGAPRIVRAAVGGHLGRS